MTLLGNSSIGFIKNVKSNCCGTKVYLNTDICSRCMEHSDVVKDVEETSIKKIKDTSNEFFILCNIGGHNAWHY